MHIGAKDPFALLAAKLGGQHVRHRDGSFWRFERDQFLVDVEPFYSPGASGLECSVEYRPFSQIVNFIAGDKPENFVSIDWFQLRSSNTQGIDELLLTTAINRATSRSIRDHISRFTAVIPEKSIPQLCHLAALAWEKDFITLLEYQATFIRGKSTRFVPMITAEMLDRASSFALEQTTN